jgi:hypothetical protein
VVNPCDPLTFKRMNRFLIFFIKVRHKFINISVKIEKVENHPFKYSYLHLSVDFANRIYGFSKIRIS